MKQEIGKRTSLRRSAIKLISEVVQDRIGIQQAIDQSKIEPKYRGWVFELISGYFRWKTTIDYWIDESLKQGKISSWARRAVGSAVYQIIKQDVDPAIVVNETVQMVKKKQGQKPASFVNAMLRDAVSKKDEIQKKGPRFSKWIRDRFVNQNGEDWTRSYEKQLEFRPKLWLCATEPLDSDKIGAKIEDGAFYGGELNEVLKTDAFESGKIFVQNISSQKAVRWVAEILREYKIKEPILDLCSAPGGKSMGLSLQGFRVVASDVSAERLKKVNENRERLKIPAENLQIKTIDEVSVSDFHAVWIDAPCSSLGLLSRHPEIQWNRNENDLSQIIDMQKQILSKAWSELKSGALVFYSVCSPLVEEGARLVTEITGQPTKADLSINPFDYEMADGFWIGVVQKT